MLSGVIGPIFRQEGRMLTDWSGSDQVGASEVAILTRCTPRDLRCTSVPRGRGEASWRYYGVRVAVAETVARVRVGSGAPVNQLVCHPRLPLVAGLDSERPAGEIRPSHDSVAPRSRAQASAIDPGTPAHARTRDAMPWTPGAP